MSLFVSQQNRPAPSFFSLLVLLPREVILLLLISSSLSLFLFLISP